MKFNYSTQQYNNTQQYSQFNGNSIGGTSTSSARVKGGFTKSHSKDITVGNTVGKVNSKFDNTINGSMAEQAYYELNKRYSR